jgi:hypothetical protein
MSSLKYLLTTYFILLTLPGFSQETERPFTKRVILKTNVLSLIAQRPTVTVEKAFSKRFSAEVSFVQGKFNNFLSTDHYNYSGFLVRAKKHFGEFDLGQISPYAALYMGDLKRQIQTIGRVDNTSWIGYPSRDFSANSIRGGGSIGLCFVAKNKIIVDGLASLGYGKYTRIYKPGTNSKGYLDAQVWLSIGYCF